MGTFTITGSDPGAASRWAELTQNFTPDYGSTSTTSTLVGPERLVARTDRDTARSALGNPLNAVIGTGRVNGAYFIGGTTQVDTRTTLTTTTTIPPEGWVVVVNSNPDAASRLASQLSLFTKKEITTETNVTTQTVTKAGYVLAYDYFERGYDLIRLEVNGQIVFDTENALSPLVEFRFYGGRQTAVDPIVDDIVGTLPGAYENMVMVFIDGFPAESPPSISAVISNAATDQLEDVRIEWTGDLPVNLYQISAGRNTTYDPGRGVLYEVFTDLEGAAGAMDLVVLDVATHTELYRVELEGTDATYSAFAHAIRGTDYVIVRTAEPNLPRIDGIYDILTGALVASYNEGSESAASLAANRLLNNFSWHMGEAFQGKWLMIGNNLAGSSSQYEPVCGVFDYAGAAIAVSRISGMPIIGASAFCYGRVSDSSASFFQLHGTALGLSFPLIREISFDGTSWSARDVYAHNIIIESFWYDPGTGYLVLSTFTTPTFEQPILQYVDPDDGTVIRTIEVTDFFRIPQGETSTGRERFWPRSGFVLLGDSPATDAGSVFQLNVAAGTITAFTTDPSDEYFTGIYDQVHGYYITGYNDQWWTIHYLPNQIPGLIDLSDAVTDIMSMAGFSAADLTFSGFGGLSTYGFVINADTNIQSAVRTVADIYDFYWCDTGSGFYFKKPGTDLALTIDATFTTDDILDRDDPVMSSDEGDIRTPSSVELEYISKEGGYRARPASFSMTTGVLNSITAPRLSTPILFHDAEAQRLVTEKFFQFQEHRRTHAFTVVPENITLLPGDIISVPSGEVAYIAAVEEIGIDLRTMGVEIAARDFATEVATTITTVSNDPGALVLLRFDSLYIHLDIPLLFFSHDLNGAGLVQYGLLAPRLATWTGANLYRGVTPSSMSLLFDQAQHHSIVAIAQDALGSPTDPFDINDTSTVTIRPIVGDTALLVDATQDAVLDHDANLALIGNNGRWELVGYTTVLDNGDGTWTLSGFVRRGYHGSEVWADDHAAGDYFIFPLAPVKRVTHPLADLDDTFYYKAVGFGQDPAGVAAFAHTIPGVAETPYAVRNITTSSTGSPNGIDINWHYRSRVADGLNPADHGEATLAFEVDVYDTGTSPPSVTRTLTATTNSVHYADADIVSDFGSYPSSLTLRVYMMSEIDVVVPGQTPVVPGRGYAASVVSVIGAKTLVAGAQSYLVTGSPVTLVNTTMVLSAAAGSYVVTGTAATLLIGEAGSLPAGATWHLDFVTGFYYAGGATRTRSAVIGSGTGGTIDNAYFTAGVGMDTQFTNTNRPVAIGTLLSDCQSMFATGISVVIEIDGDFGSADFIGFWDDVDPNSATNVADIFSQANLGIEDFDSVFATTSNGVGSGVHKIGGTWFLDVGGGNYQSAVCVDGGSAATDTTAYGGSSLVVDYVSIGHLSDQSPFFFGVVNDGFVVRSITGYPAMTASALSGLTALPGDKTITAAAASYAVTGTAATLTKTANKIISAAAGSYAVTGTAATLTKTAAPAGFSSASPDLHPQITLSNSNFTATRPSGSGNFVSVRGLTSHSSGKYYYEMHIDLMVTAMLVGVCNSTQSFGSFDFLGSGTDSAGIYFNGNYFPGNVASVLSSWTTGDTICVAVDLTADKIWFRKNGGSWSDSGDPAAGTGGRTIPAGLLTTASVYIGASLFDSAGAVTANTGNTAFAQTMPSGFTAWG